MVVFNVAGAENLQLVHLGRRVHLNLIQMGNAHPSFAVHALTTERLLICPSTKIRVLRCACPAPFLVGCRENKEYSSWSTAVKPREECEPDEAKKKERKPVKAFPL